MCLHSKYLFWGLQKVVLIGPCIFLAMETLATILNNQMDVLFFLYIQNREKQLVNHTVRKHMLI